MFNQVLFLGKGQTACFSVCSLLLCRENWQGLLGYTKKIDRVTILMPSCLCVSMCKKLLCVEGIVLGGVCPNGNMSISSRHDLGTDVFRNTKHVLGQRCG